MNFSDQIIYNKLVKKVIKTVRESEINNIKIFQNDKALAVSVRNSYSEDQFIHTFLDNLQQCVK